MTNFKIGDVVYDEVNFPNQKGIVQDGKINSKYCVAVRFNNRLSCEYYTKDGAIQDDSIPTLSHTPYTIEFKGFSQVRPLTDEQKVCIKGDGTMEYGDKIINYLLGLGGINKNVLFGYFETYYYLEENLIIRTKETIPEGYKEISLKEVEPMNYVGKKIVIDDDTCLIVSQNKVRIETSKYLIKLENIHKYEIID